MPFEAASRGRAQRFPFNGMSKMCEHRSMFVSVIRSRLRPARVIVLPLLAMLSAAAPAASAAAAGCSFAPQGEGRVAEIIDGRSFRLTDGREIRLAGVEPVPSEKDAVNGTSALSAILAGRDVALRADDDTPDRYGRQTAFVFLASSETLVQSLLLTDGEALASGDIADKECQGTLMTAEGEARRAKKEFGIVPRP
jgi:endonuclease YncB( thermonuclease family)